MLEGRQIGGSEVRSPKQFHPDEVRRLAEQRAAAQRYVSSLAMHNIAGMPADEAIKSAAAMQLASDAFNRIDHDYRRALASLPTVDLMAFVGL